MAKTKQKPRRIEVHDAQKNLVRAEVTWPEFRPPGLLGGFEDSHNPRLKELRKTYRTRIRGGSWRPLRGTTARIKLAGRTTTVDFRARNRFNVDGPVVTLAVHSR